MKTPDTESYYYKLLTKKFRTSEIVRSQIAAIKEKMKKDVVKEPLKLFSVNFKGQVIENSFEQTLKIISKRLFHKGKIDRYKTIKERGMVVAHFTAAQTELEELIRYLMKRHVVLHCKKGIPKGASNMLIIDEDEQKQLKDFTPDYVNCNYVTTAETCEKYTGVLGDYLIVNGLPLTTKTLGKEFRFNEIVTTNKVFTSTGLKEIFLNLHFITLVLMLDLEQHYFKLRILNAQEKDLKAVEDNIDNLGLFTELFEHITSKANPLLYNSELFIDVIRLEHIIEKDSWKSLPAYDSYVYSATNRLNNHFKFLEEFGLFQTYANCGEKFIDKLNKKLLQHNANLQSEQNDLSSNYHELKKLETISSHPLLRSDYLEMLSLFRTLLAYMDSLSIQDNGADVSKKVQKESPLPARPSKGLFATIKDRARSLLSSSMESTQTQILQKKQSLTTEQEEEARNLLSRVSEKLQKISKLKTASGGDAYLEARKNVPFLTNLSDALAQLKALIKDIERGKDIQDQFKNIFDRKNRFIILFNKLSKLVKFKTKQEEKMVRDIFSDLQKHIHTKPLKEEYYQQIIDNVNRLEEFIMSRNDTALQQEIGQNKTFNIMVDIKNGIQNILEKEKQIRKIDSFKDESEFLSFSEKELDSFLEELVAFHKKLKRAKYYGSKSDLEKTEKKFDKLIVEVNDIEARMSSRKRSKSNTVYKESEKNIDYMKSSMLTRRNLEKPIILAQYQVDQILGFIKTIKSFLDQQTFVHSGVSTSVLFDQITYLLSNTDVRLLDLTKLTEDMYNESIETIFRYQVGETFNEPKNKDMKKLMKEIEKKAIVKAYKRQG